MRYLLSQFESIPQEAIDLLARHGIMETDKLLEQAALPKQRRLLAQKVKIKTIDLTDWASMADLVRVKGVTPGLAELLVKSKIARNVQMLAETTHDSIGSFSKTEASLIHHKTTARLPSRKRLLSISEEAAELRPRLQLAESGKDKFFRQEVITRLNKERVQSNRISRALIGLTVLAAGILFTIFRVYFNQLMRAKIIPGDEINKLAVEIAQITMQVVSSSLLLVIAILMVMLVGLYFFYNWISHLQNVWGALWLFDHPQHRKFYSAIKSINLSREVQGLWWAVGIFALIVIGLVLVGSNLITQDLSLEDTAKRMSSLVVGGGILLGIATSIPVLRFYLLEFKNHYDFASIQRYMIFYLSKIILIPPMVVILTQIAMPMSFMLHQHIYLSSIVPSARQKYIEIRTEVVNLETKNAEEEDRRTNLLRALDEEVVFKLDSLGAVLTDTDSSVVDFYIPAALNMVVWLALTAYLLLFVVPYLILGGWRRGLFYILILITSFNLENALSNYSPTWFSLPQNSISSLLTVAFFVFANALFFDWVFTTLTERAKICPACENSLTPDAYYCSNCGFVQE
jgi:hypothetical protein